MTDKLREALETVQQAAADLQRDMAVSYTHLTLPTTPYV